LKTFLIAVTSLTAIFLLFFRDASGQVAVNSDGSQPNTSAMLEVKSSSKGFLLPRMTSFERTAITGAVDGLMVYDTDVKDIFIFRNGAWSQSLSNGSGWRLAGNGGTNSATSFIGTTDNVPLTFRTNNLQCGQINPALNNASYGPRAFAFNSTGVNNTVTGGYALFSNLSGGFNTATGALTLYENNGYNNSAHGFSAMYSNTDGYFNTANGSSALYHNTSASRNTAIGANSLYTQSYSPGYAWESENVAVGYYALYFNQPVTLGTGVKNTAVGSSALFSNTQGYQNSSLGYNALYSNTQGTNNSAFGWQALSANISGWQNTSFGANSMNSNTIGSYNTAVGFNTGPNANNLDNTTCLGIDATATATNMVRIGNVFVTSIGGYQGWSNISDGRFKEDVEENVPGLDFITRLRPVTYRLDREKINEFTGVNKRRKETPESAPGSALPGRERYSEVTTGFIAQEVEVAAKNVGFDFSGVDAPKNANDMYGLRYSEFVVPLVKAVQEQQDMIAELKQQNAELLRRIENLEKR
jgi:hypothetical protein